MTVRETIATMLSYLRVEQRAIPYAGGADYEDPLPDALAACNAALQQMAALLGVAEGALREAIGQADSRLELANAGWVRRKA